MSQLDLFAPELAAPDDPAAPVADDAALRAVRAQQVADFDAVFGPPEAWT